MRLFSCQSCAQILYFENNLCERCGHALGFDAEDGDLHAMVAAPNSTGDTWVALGASDGKTFRQCENAKHNVCNWLVEADSDETFCAACRHNRIIPELNITDNLVAWRKIETAKHRLFYTLDRLGLLHAIDMQGGPEPLVFEFLADQPNPQGQKVMTGHDNGLITIALSEADDAEREQRKKAMGEPYRTLLGHFRHEIGHYIWDRLVRDGGKIDACRAVFGDESQDYGEALQRHYKDGAPVDWQQTFVSSYATAHPWEDFAETWAHYLHIVDTLEMARSFGLKMAPAVDTEGRFAVDYALDPYKAPDIQSIVDVWVPVSAALNSLSRAMGQDELYPFILSAAIVEKIGFIQQLVRDAVANAPAQKPAPTPPQQQQQADVGERRLAS